MPNSRWNKTRLERRFPVRVRVAVLDRGFGEAVRRDRELLHSVYGRGRWASHPGGRDAFPIDTTLFYFADAAAVTAFLETFDLETVEVDVTLAGGSGDRLLHLHGATREPDVARG